VWCTYREEYYSAMKTNEGLSFVSWTNLEDIMLSDISQPQKDKYWVISSEAESKNIKLMETDRA
jgi:hypothetical protein